jgi:D-glycero-D-manno-heptose 1,7-bisphosphate phosphatase
MKNEVRRAVFLDRDGVLNEDNPNYTYDLPHFKILPGVPEAIRKLKSAGYLLIVVTNQSGIDKGIYSIEQMKACHEFLQTKCERAIDHFYYSPYHRTVTNSLLTKPGSLMFEKAIAKFNIDVSSSWMIGDRGRDLAPARLLGIKTIQIGDDISFEKDRGDYKVDSLLEAVEVITDSGSQSRSTEF